MIGLYLIFFLAFVGTKQMEGLILLVYKAIKERTLLARNTNVCQRAQGKALMWLSLTFMFINNHPYLTTPEKKVHEGYMDHPQCKFANHMFSSRYLLPVLKKEETFLSREAIGFRMLPVSHIGE